MTKDTASKRPFMLSKAKLQTFFVNEAGQPISRTTFREQSQLFAFCEATFGMTQDEFRRRKAFFGDEVVAILEQYQIDVADLF